jgi:hypothetical protein
MQLQDTYISLFNTQIRSNVQRIESNNTNKYETFCLKLHDCVVTVNRCVILGYITSVDRWHNKISIYVDDGTSNVQCVQWINDHEEEENEYEVGLFIELRGKLHLYKDCIQINIEQWSTVTSHLYESQFWLNCIETQKYLVTELTRIEDLNIKHQQQLVSDDINTDQSEDRIGYSLYEYLNTLERHTFSVRDLIKDKHIISLFMNNRMNQVLLLKILNKLFNSNYIGTTEENITNNSSFQLITLKDHLVPSISKFIQQKQIQSEHEREEGVPFSFIVNEMKRRQHYPRIQIDMIRQCIEYMINESIIYETNRPQCYKIIV